MMRAWPLALSVCLFLVLALRHPAAAQEPSRAPMPPEAKAHWDLALKNYGEKNFDAAVVEFKAAYEIDPRREFLFAWAQAERLSGDCPSAVLLYQRYIDTQPHAKQAEAAHKHLDRCNQALKTRPEGAPPAASPGPPTPADSPTAADDPARPEPAPTLTAPAPAPARGPPRPPWYKDVAGDLLLGVGIVGLGVGTTFYVVSENGARDGAPTFADYAARFPSHERQRTVALVSLGAGVTFATAAILRYLLR